MAHKPSIRKRRITAARPWNSARPYIGLTQACRVLRKEFGPMYFENLRYTLDLHDFDRFIDTFELTNFDESIRGVVTALRQERLHKDGIDILPLLRFMGSSETRSKIRFVCEKKRDWDLIDLTGRLHHRWHPEQENQNITHVMLHHRPVLTDPSDRRNEFETVILITLHPNYGWNKTRTQTIGKEFIRTTDLETGFDLIVECRCDKSKSIWQIENSM